MNILHLPPNTQLHTKVHYRPIQYGYPIGYPYDYPLMDVMFTGVDNWLELTINDISEFYTLVTEIDLSSKNRFITYEESDIDWLLYCEPNRMIRREPRSEDIVKVSIENVQYKAAIYICPVPYTPKYQTPILIRATLLSN